MAKFLFFIEKAGTDKKAADGKEQIDAVVALVGQVIAGGMSNPGHNSDPAVGKQDTHDRNGTPSVQRGDVADLLSHSRQCLTIFPQ